jgi:hypothetical protein
MQEKKPSQFDDLDIITISGGDDVISSGVDTIDLSGVAAQSTYNFDYDYSTVNYNMSASNITTITLPNTVGGGGSAYTISTGTSGGYYGGNGSSSGYVFTDTTTGWVTPKVNITQGGIEMPKEADLKIGDRSLKEFMEKVEEHLAILRPSPEVEERWEELKKLRTAYEDLLKDILEKEKIMDILKKK